MSEQYDTSNVSDDELVDDPVDEPDDDAVEGGNEEPRDADSGLDDSDEVELDEATDDEGAEGTQ